MTTQPVNAVSEQIHVATEKQTTENKYKHGMPAAVRVIMCILLSLLLIADVVIITAVMTIRTFVTEENIEAIVANTDYMTIPITAENIQSNIYEILIQAFAGEKTSTVDLYKLAEDTRFEKFVTEQLYDYASFILYDERLEGIDSDTIMEFYDKNADTISEAFGVNHSRSEIADAIEGQDELFEKLTNNEIEASIPMIKLIRFAVSIAALIIFAVVAVMLIVLIGIISRSVGTPFVVTGISVLATGLAGAAAAYPALFDKIGVSSASVTAASVIWQGVVSTIISDILTVFIYISAGGILLILTGILIGALRRNSRLTRE